MKIDSIQIDGFGKLCNYSWQPSPGFNLIYGANEAGKSTLLAFIRAMLYGLNDRKQKQLADDPRNRYFPWDQQVSFGGSLICSHEGATYRINRQFGSTKRQDSLQFMNHSTGTEIALKKGTEPGDYLFSIREEEFENTVFIAQMESVMKGSGTIQSKLMQLTSGTGPKRSAAEMKRHLQEKLKAYQKNSENSRDRQLVKAVEAKRSELAQAIADEDERLRLRKAIRKLEERLTTLRHSRAEVKLSLETEEKLRRKNGAEKYFGIQKEIGQLDIELKEVEIELGEEPRPSHDDVKFADELIRKWERHEEQLRLYHQQETEAAQSLAQWPEELALAARIERLDAFSQRLLELRRHEQVTAQLAEEDERSFEKVLAQLEQDIEKTLNEQAAVEKDRQHELERYQTLSSSIDKQLERLAARREELLERHRAELLSLAETRKQREESLAAYESNLMALDARKQELAEQSDRAEKEARSYRVKEEQTTQRIEEIRAESDSAGLEQNQPGRRSEKAGVAWIVSALLLAVVAVLQFAIGDLLFVIGGIVSVIGALLCLFYVIQSRHQTKGSQSAAAAYQARLLGDRAELAETLDSQRSSREYYEEQLTNSQSAILAIESDLKSAQEAIDRLRTGRDQLAGQWAEKNARQANDLTADVNLEEELLRNQISELDRRHAEAQAVFLEKAEYLAKLHEALLKESAEQRFSLSEETVSEQARCRDESDLLLREMSDVGISDEDQLKAERERTAEQLLKQKAVADQIDKSKAGIESVNRELASVRSEVNEVTKGRVNTADAEAAKQALYMYSDKLRKQGELRKDLSELRRQAGDAISDQNNVDPHQLLIQVEEWLKENEAAVLLYTDYGQQALEDQSDDLNRQIQDVIGQKAAWGRSLEILEKDVRLIPDLEREIEGLEAEYQVLLFQADAIRKAIWLIERSDEEVRRNFGPLIDERTNLYLERLTGISSSQLKVSSTFGMELTDQDSMLRDKDHFSQGRVDQLYLALRLAVAETIYDGQVILPLFYDDILVSYDGGRGRRTFEFLAKHCADQGRQVFFVTCHEQFHKWASELALTEVELMPCEKKV